MYSAYRTGVDYQPEIIANVNANTFRAFLLTVFLFLGPALEASSSAVSKASSTSRTLSFFACPHSSRWRVCRGSKFVFDVWIIIYDHYLLYYDKKASYIKQTRISIILHSSTAETITISCLLEQRERVKFPNFPQPGT